MANYPLYIILPRTSGTGTDAAIPSTHRIFKAYPGIEYNIRAGVIGGLWPYTYSLVNQPSGMTINSFTGEISWPNPTTGTHGPITFSVTDSESTTESTTWTIEVTTTGFIFVDSSYSGGETGSISQPFSSISNLLNNTGSQERHHIVYFRQGDYILIDHNSTCTNPGGITGKYGTNLSGHPYMWIGYPGETVNIDGDKRYIQHWSTSGIYFDNLNLSNFTDYGIRAYGSANYAVICRCEWSNIESVQPSNENFGYYFSANTDFGYYLTFQDNVFSGYRRTAAAIGSLYAAQKVLIENNLFGGTSESSSQGFSGSFPALAIKQEATRTTIRANVFTVSATSFFGSTLNGTFAGSKDVEIYHNLFMQASGNVPNETINTHTWDGYGGGPGIHFYRNTIVGNISFSKLDGDLCDGYDPPYTVYNESSLYGPFIFKNNVIINPTFTSSTWAFDKRDHIQFRINPPGSCNTDSAYWLCIDEYDNLKGTVQAGIIDSKGNLTGEYENYIGIRGWQLSDGTTPMDYAYGYPDHLGLSSTHTDPYSYFSPQGAGNISAPIILNMTGGEVTSATQTMYLTTDKTYNNVQISAVDADIGATWEFSENGSTWHENLNLGTVSGGVKTIYYRVTCLNDGTITTNLTSAKVRLSATAA